MYFITRGNVGIGLSVPKYPLDVSGNVNIINTNGVINLQSGSYSNNVGIGNVFNTQITSGTQNTAIGSPALQYLTTSSQNTAVGSNALKNVSSSIGYNTAVGVNTLQGVTSSSMYNTAIGYNAYSDTPFNNSTAIGYSAKPTGSNQVVLGTSAEKVIIPGTMNSTGLGTGALQVAGGVGIQGNLYVGGSTYSTYFITTSDYRIKANVNILGNYYSVDELNPVQYNNRLSGKTDIGFLAHEVQNVFPELVEGEKDGDTYQSLNYTGLIAVLVKELKEVKERLSIAENQIQQLLSKGV